MHSQEIVQKYQLVDTTNSIDQIRIKSEQTQSNDVKAFYNFVAQVEIIGFLLFCGFLAFLNSRHLKALSDNCFINSKNSNHELPCQTCHYYSRNQYLYCAIHPSIAMSEQAKDCSDYSMKIQKISLKSKLMFWK
ncbi:hypothetical protein NIES4071_02770 [Calothrix sp. NIES-4071]|nr:hypothetical protein NIES4071_02770 [Calothrix sp. NIES-4071]BAZ54623.1 hypothetical protein NIES4105_02760 [Calothrix sp. NIES-4105]